MHPVGGRGQQYAVLRFTLCLLAVIGSACHSGEKHAAQQRMRKILEGVTRQGNVDHAVCLWAHGSTFCPGGADDFAMSATQLESALKAKGIAAFNEVKSFEIGEATYKRGDGGMFKISPVVEVKLKINGADLAVECIDGEVVTWVDCDTCASEASVAAVGAAPVGNLPAQGVKPPPRPTPKPSQRPTLDGPKLFALVSPSVLVIEALDKRGKTVMQGSAVSVDKGTAITNWHVISKAVSIKIVKGDNRFDATLDAVLEDRDLARLRTSAELVPVVLADTLPTVGEATFALGAPFGFDLTISEGILSGRREDETEKTEYLQTTAPISSGSSGGGLFNARGELIGITTLQVRPAQNLNFALPSSYVAELMALPSGTLPEAPVSLLTKLSAADRKWLQLFVRNMTNLDKEFRYSALESDRARALIASIGPLESWQKDALRFELGGGRMSAARAFWEDAIDARARKKFQKSSKRLKLERELLKRSLITEAEVQAGDRMMETIAAGTELVLDGLTVIAEERVLAGAMEIVARREALVESILWR